MKTKTLLARCRAATGNGNAAALLQRIAYWMPKATREFGGNLWIAKSADDWCLETGLSFDQYRRGMALLKGKRLGLVVVERHKFGARTITHVRLTEAGNLAVAALDTTAAHCTVCNPAHCTVDEDAHCTVGEDAHCLDKGDTLTTYTQLPPEGVLAHAVPRVGTDIKRIPGEKDKQMHPRKPYTTKDIPAGGSPKPGKAVTKLHQPDKVANLEAVWKDTLTEVTGSFVVGLTIKQKGQLKHFMQACPPGTAADVLRHVLQDWVTFALEAQADGDVKSSPDQPEVGFLLKYVSTAVRLHLEATQPKPALGGKPASVAQVPAPVQLTAEPKPVDDYQPATKAEMMAILGIEPIPELPQKPGGAKPSKPSQKGTP